MIHPKNNREKLLSSQAKVPIRKSPIKWEPLWTLKIATKLILANDSKAKMVHMILGARPPRFYFGYQVSDSVKRQRRK